MVPIYYRHIQKQRLMNSKHGLWKNAITCLRTAVWTYFLKRYVIHTHQLLSFETPQEMFMGIAMHLAMNETQNRSQWVKRFYDMLSQLQVTMATPTLSNARKPFHQLSSCFIDTVPDSLTGIYRSITNFAQVSKFGGEWECTLAKFVLPVLRFVDFKGLQAV